MEPFQFLDPEREPRGHGPALSVCLCPDLSKRFLRRSALPPSDIVERTAFGRTRLEDQAFDQLQRWDAHQLERRGPLIYATSLQELGRVVAFTDCALRPVNLAEAERAGVF